MSYDKVTETLNVLNLSWSDVDKILLSEDSYQEFRERAPFSPSDYETTDMPAVRRTEAEERIVLVTKAGQKEVISLE
jgi:hypothetical protein